MSCVHELLMRFLGTGKCRYWKRCPYYDERAFTCHTYDAEGGYCGKYREFAEAEEGEKGK
jgi:hypothetical protein